MFNTSRNQINNILYNKRGNCIFVLKRHNVNGMLTEFEWFFMCDLA